MSDDGRAYEEDFAEALGAELVPNSGQGKWAKMDVRGLEILFSCKWTGKETRSIKPDEFDEVERAVRGPGGVKGDVLPAMAIGIKDRSYVVMDAFDFAELILNREPQTVVMNKAESRRALVGETPLQRLMREGSDGD